MVEPLPGVFSQFADDKVRAGFGDIVIDNFTVAGTDASDPFLRDALYSAGGAFFRPEVDRQSHGLNKLQLATSDPQVKHGECFQLLPVEADEAEVLEAEGIKIEEMEVSRRGQKVKVKFIRTPLLTRDQLLDQLAKKPRTELDRQCVALGVAPDALVERLPYQGRGGQILESSGYKYTGTRFDEMTVGEVEDLFELFESYKLYGQNREEVKGFASLVGGNIGTAHAILDRIRSANILRAELLELSSGDIPQEEEEEEGETASRFPRPQEFVFPESFCAFDDYATFIWHIEKAPHLIPSLNELKAVLPKAVAKKVKWPKSTENPQEFWKVVCNALVALQKWEDQRLQDWQERCQDGWETLGGLAATIPGGFFGMSDDEELGEVDSPFTYFQSDEIEVRPRQGLLSQPLSESEEELTVGDLHLRIKGHVTTPKDFQVFMGNAGPGASELPYAKMNENDVPGMPVKYRGHPLADRLDFIVQLASQSRDPVAIELVQEPFEVRRVTIAEMLYGRHNGYHAARGLQQEIRRLERGAQKLNWVIPHVQSPADRQLLEEDLQAALEQIVICEDLLPEQETLEAQWKADVAAEVKALNRVVPLRLRTKDGRFRNFDSYLVNPVWGWNRKTKKPKLIGGEYWVPTQSVFPLNNQKETRARITVHVYPVQAVTGHTVSLWYVWQNKTVIRKEAKNDPLLVKYGPDGEDPQMKVHFRSFLDAEAERFGLRRTPVLTETYQIEWQLIRDVFPDACRFVKALSEAWHQGVENLLEVDDESAKGDDESAKAARKGKLVQTQIRLAKKNSKTAEEADAVQDPNSEEPFEVLEEGVPDVFEVQTHREDLYLAMWEELRLFQDNALDLAIRMNYQRHLNEVVEEMRNAYFQISVNPQWGWKKNQESGWSFSDRVLKAGGTLDRALSRVREFPVLPLLKGGEIPVSSTFWKAFGYLGCERPVSFIGTMVADRLYHANPGLAGWRVTDQGKRWQRAAGAFEAWRFSEGPLGRLKNALYAIMYPKAGLEGFNPPLELVQEMGIEEATLTHLREQVQVFLGRTDEKVVRQLFGLLGIPTYGEADELALMVKVNQLLEADKQPQSELETLVRQLWVQEPKARDEILEDLLSKEGRRIYGHRLWPMLRDFGVLREGKVRPDPSCHRLSFCEPYVRTPAERL